jgi:hypothetical protein
MPEDYYESRWVRSLLGDILRTDGDLDAFCIDHFPDVHGRFCTGMDRVQKVNLLLTLQAPGTIVERLREGHPEQMSAFERTRPPPLRDPLRRAPPAHYPFQRRADALAELGEVLADAYPTSEQALRVASGAGLAPALDLACSARHAWSRVLDEAGVAGAVILVVATALREHPGLRHGLGGALGDYLQFASVPEKPLPHDDLAVTPRPPRSHAAKATAQHLARAATVLFIEGRDRSAGEYLRGTLAALGLEVLGWNDAVALTRQAHPDALTVLDAAFSRAAVFVALLSGDEDARLRRSLSALENAPAPQPRPEVLVRASLARALQPRATVIVQVGRLRPIADLPFVPLDGSPDSLDALAAALTAAGCKIARDRRASLAARPAEREPPALADGDRLWSHAVAFLRPLKTFLPFPRMGGEMEMVSTAAPGEKISLSLRIPAGTADVEVHHWAPGALDPAPVTLDGARRTTTTIEVDWRVAGPYGDHYFDVWAREDAAVAQRLVARGRCTVCDR